MNSIRSLLTLFAPIATLCTFSANPKGIVSSSPGLRDTSYPGAGEGERPNRNAVASRSSQHRHNRVAVDGSSTTPSQGSSFVATLGFESESRWDSTQVVTMVYENSDRLSGGASVIFRREIPVMLGGFINPGRSWFLLIRERILSGRRGYL